MDFLIAGLGLGALATLAGLILRDRGASSQRRGSRSSAAPAEDLQARALGAGLIGAGLALILVTAAAIAFAPSDAAGSAAVGAAVVACGLGAFAWSRMAARTPVPAAAGGGAGRHSGRARAVPSMPSRRPEAAPLSARAKAARSTGQARMAPETAAARRLVAAPVPDLPAPRNEEFVPAMDPALAEDLHDLPLPSPAGIPAVDGDASVRRGGNPASARAAARPERPVGEPDNRAEAFAVIPLFRESDPADDLASAFLPIGGAARGGDRPLPWEMAQAQEDEFIVDPALAAERLEDLPPPIPFSRTAPRD